MVAGVKMQAMPREKVPLLPPPLDTPDVDEDDVDDDDEEEALPAPLALELVLLAADLDGAGGGSLDDDDEEDDEASAMPCRSRFTSSMESLSSSSRPSLSSS